MYDLVIRNALIHDGSGRPPRRGSLAVSAGTIAAVCAADEQPGPARETIDADGLAVMPGIIDNHTHYDAQITWDRTLESSAAQGVTTVLLGNCGFAIAPCRPQHRDYTMRTLTQVEGMALAALRAGIRWDFETFPQYLDMLERNGCALNVAVYVGHSAVRTFVMGEDSARRPAQPAEIERMAALVTEALQAGAVGFATSTSPAHNGEGGLPVPSRLADEAELRALLGCLGKAGRGTFMLTKGGQTRLDFLEELGGLSGRPVVVAALLHNRTNPHGVFGELDYLQSASARGRTMVGAVSCCPLTMEFTLAAPYPLEGLHGWQPALGLQGSEYRALLRDPGFRQALRRELSQPAAFRLFNGEWQEVRVLETKLARNAHLEQQSIAEIARPLARDPLDVFLDLALEEDLATVFAGTLLNSDEEAVGRLLRHPASLVSLSDAGAHLTFFNDAGFGLHLIGHWARDRAAMSIEEAIAKLTAQPARLFGLSGRGLLQPGYAADLVLFDVARIGRGSRRKTHDLPAGAARLHTEPVGIHGVWVNGTRIADERGLCDPVRSGTRLPGTLIRRFDQPR
jgi:N-acyl-D-amino-acid deacylase